MSFPSRIVIVHGYQAHPAAHWFPWLAQQAADRGGRVDVVALPDADHPTRAGWDAAVADAIGEPDAGTWVIGHSLGSITALRWAAALPAGSHVGGVLLVAGFGERLHTIPELDEYLAHRFTAEDAARVRDVAGAVRAIHSDDDAIVPPPYSERLAALLGVEPLVVAGGGHFLDRKGWLEHPEVLAALHG